MRYLLLVTSFTVVLFSLAPAQNYTLQKYVIASGGGEMTSTNNSINGTVGQPAVGTSSSDNYGLEGGFWVVGGGGTGGVCDYAVGDVNGSTSYNGLDITYGVNFFKGGSLPLCPACSPCSDFYYCGDVNSSCSYNGLDITYGVNYFKGGSSPVPCTDCPPSSFMISSSEGQMAKPAVIVNPHVKKRKSLNK
jgi:hypothetical protein